MDRKFLLTAFGYAILGLALGIHMAASKNHGQMVTHAHIMLVGFVVSFVYAVCHKLWLPSAPSKLASAQYYVHQLGSFLLLVGLFLAYGNFVQPQFVEPVLSVGSLTVFVGLIMMKIYLLKSYKKPA